MQNLPEDPDERRMFDDMVRAYSGRPLAAIAASLTIISRAQPPEGSLGKMFAIYANEIARQDKHKQLVIDQYAALKSKFLRRRIKAKRK